MKLSVVVPFYDNHDTINDCISGILNSNFADSINEIIIVDDGSKQPLMPSFFDSSAPIALIRQENAGVSAARNTGARAAKNNWISFCDADDQWHSEKLFQQFAVMDACQFDVIGALRDTSKKIVRERLYFIDLLYLLFQWDPHISTLIIKRDIFFNVGGFDEDLRRGEDCEFYLRLLQLVKVIPIIPISLVSQIRSKSPFGEKGLSADLKRMYQGELLILDRAMKSSNLSELKFIFRIYYFLRYLRRCIITKLRMKKCLTTQ